MKKEQWVLYISTRQETAFMSGKALSMPGKQVCMVYTLWRAEFDRVYTRGLSWPEMEGMEGWRQAPA